jgi:hypothetical protein
MNWFANLLVVSGAGAAGYFAEPSLRLELTGNAPTKAPEAVVKKLNEVESVLGKVDLTRYSYDQLPKDLTLKKDAQVVDSGSGTKMTIPAGSHVKLVRKGEGALVISTGAANIEGTVEVEDTDIREQIIANPPVELAAEPTKSTPKPADPLDMMAGNGPAETETPEAEPAEAKTPVPAETAATEPAMKEEPAADKPAEPAAPEPAVSSEFAPATPEDIVKTMQDSIKAEQVKSVKFDQASEWVAGEPETVDGKQFNTGVVSYKSQTFLGVKTVQAKAYIVGGKVVRWVNQKSGTELQ